MKNKRFVTSEEIQEDFSVSRAKAYAIIRQLNDELEQAGMIMWVRQSVGEASHIYILIAEKNDQTE